MSKLTDDVWSASVEAGKHDYELEKTIKQLSGCLHDIRAGHDTKWYANKKEDE